MTESRRRLSQKRGRDAPARGLHGLSFSLEILGEKNPCLVAPQRGSSWLGAPGPREALGSGGGSDGDSGARSPGEEPVLFSSSFPAGFIPVGATGGRGASGGAKGCRGGGEGRARRELCGGQIKVRSGPGGDAASDFVLVSSGRRQS